MSSPLVVRNQSVVRGWVTLVVAASLVLGLLAGLVYAIATALGGHRPDAAKPTHVSSPTSSMATVAPSTQSSLDQHEDALAAKPMLSLPASAANPQPIVSVTAGAAIVLPRAHDHSLVVPSGFPKTAAGAVAQLAAIDETAWDDVNPTQVRQVYAWAAAPGAVNLSDWTPYVGAVSLLSSAGAPHGSTTLETTFTPTHALVKGVLDDGNFVLACVLGEFDASYRNSSKVGIGDCQRMVWSSGRWRIGPGRQPAFAPSAWPGSADCVRAGWRPIAGA